MEITDISDNFYGGGWSSFDDESFRPDYRVNKYNNKKNNNDNDNDNDNLNNIKEKFYIKQVKHNKYLTSNEYKLQDIFNTLNINNVSITNDNMFLYDKILCYINILKNNNEQFSKDLLEFINKYSSEKIKLAEGYLQTGKLRFEDLWYYYQSDNYYYAKKHTELQAIRLIHSEYIETTQGPKFYIKYTFVNSDGKNLLNVKHDNQLDQFNGVCQLDDLIYKPLNNEIKETLINRGKIFAKYAVNYHYLSCTGDFIVTTYRKQTITPLVNTRVVVDHESYYNLNNDENISGLTIAYEKQDNNKIYKEETYLLCNCFVYCNINRKNTWGAIPISSLSEIVFSTNSFNNINLSEFHKKILIGITEHSNKRLTDLSPFKGDNVNILLHGPPGSGKTITAETLAEYKKVPVCFISAGMLGSDLKKFEEKLQKFLNLANRWNAICLIDEADVFFHKRGDNINLNSIVSIMLTTIEQFNGIIMLTTNTINNFDDASLSRMMHIIKYEAFNENERLNLWKKYINQTDFPDNGITDEQFIKISEYQFDARRIVKLCNLAYMTYKQPSNETLYELLIELSNNIQFNGINS